MKHLFFSFREKGSTDFYFMTILLGKLLLCFKSKNEYLNVKYIEYISDNRLESFFQLQRSLSKVV